MTDADNVTGSDPFYSDVWRKTGRLVYNKTKKVLSKYVGRTTLITQQRVTDLTKYYACSIQSLMQIAYMEKLIGSYSDKNIKDFYANMRDRKMILKNSSPDKNGVVTGFTYLGNAAKAFVNYAVDAGYKGTKIKKSQENPDIDWIRNKIEYNRPILFAYHMNLKSGKIGHMLSILGVMKAKKVSSGNTWNYIMVYNGWDGEVRFINYDCVDFVDSIATYFWVKK